MQQLFNNIKWFNFVVENEANVYLFKTFMQRLYICYVIGLWQ